MSMPHVVALVFANCFLKAFASYHWVVTEPGKIQSQVENSGFPLTKQDDLLVFLEQEERLNTINELYQELLTLKKSIDEQWARVEGEGDLEKRLYSTDIDCLLGGVPLSQHNLNMEFLDYGQGSRPKMKDPHQYVEPDCTAYSNLDFSMRTFPHLDTLKKRNDNNLTFTPMPSKTIFDFNIDGMLKLNNSDWTAYNIASLYWRTVGNGTNAVECARRALHFSPRNERYIVLLNLGTLLQELQSLGEAAIVLHSAVDHDPIQYISHLALGNVYAALGDYQRSLACYDNVLSLNPGNVHALQLKHALLCRKKLETGLLGIHFSLQNILQDLQKHNAMHEEWLFLQNQVNWERDSKIKEFFSLSQPLYLNLKMLLQNVEQQAKSLNEEVSKIVPQKSQIRFVENGESQFLKCNSEQCSTYKGADKNNKNERAEESSHHIMPIHDINEAANDEETESYNLIGSENLVKNKMNSLINSIKSRYESEAGMVDFKQKINEPVNFKKTIEEISNNGHFSADQSFLINSMDGCIKDSSEIKKLT